MNTYTVYDATGRKTKSVGNYVAQATPPDQWVWREVSGVFGWRLSLTNDTLVSHGANKDENIITSNKYDLAGRVKEVRDTLGRLTQYTYDAVGRLTKTIANFVDGVFSSSATDEDITSQTVYNKAGQVMNTTDPHGTMTEFAYDVAGRRVSIKHAKNTALESVNYTCFNKAGWVLRTISNTIATATSPDAKTGTAWDFNPTAHGTYNDENLITEYEFDTLGRQTKVINPLGEFTSTTYAKDGSVMTVTDPEGTVTAYRYDKLRRRRMIVQGYVANGQDPANWVWDATDARWEESNMINVKVEHGTDNDQNIIVQLTHDIAGRVLTMRNPRGHVTSYAYDNLNRRIQLQNPLGNTWLTSYEELGDGGRRTVTTYPENTTPVPFKTTREFDRMGRLMSIGYGDYAVTNTPNVQFGYDVLGNRTSMSELGVVDALIRQTQFEYDDARRMKTVGYDSDGDAIINETVSYEYDERGLRTKLTFDGKNITYVYDAKGRLISMTDWDSRTTTYDYDDVNRHRLTSRQNGVTSAYAHNTAGGLTDIHHKNSSNATLARFTYTLDGRGHRTQANETLNGSPKTVTYAYDQLARVKNAKYYTGTVPTGTPADEYAYTFDVAGNRLSESHAVNGGTPTVTNYTYNSANRLTNAGYTYDANGNLTNNGVSSYTWDRANRLLSHNGLTYTYDGLGNRLTQHNGTTLTEYLIDQQPSLAVVLRQKIGSQNTHYVHGLRGIQSQVANSAWTEAMSDGLGSVRGWLNGSQAFVSDVDYNPYGVPDASVVGYGFTGEMTDVNGLVHLRARYYDPNVGVFASLDPFEGVHNRPMSVNGYSWVSGNPINYIDPTGKFDWESRMVEQDDTLSCIAKECGILDLPVPFEDGSNLYYAEFLREIQRSNSQLIGSDYRINNFGQTLNIPDSITLFDGRKAEGLIQKGIENSGTACGPISALRRVFTQDNGVQMITPTPTFSPTPTCTPTPSFATPNPSDNCTANLAAVTPIGGIFDWSRIRSVGAMVSGSFAFAKFFGATAGGSITVMVEVNNGAINTENCEVFAGPAFGTVLGIDVSGYSNSVAAILSTSSLGGDSIIEFNANMSGTAGIFLSPNYGISRSFNNCDYTSMLGVSISGTPSASAEFTLGASVKLGSCRDIFRESYGDWIRGALPFVIHHYSRIMP